MHSRTTVILALLTALVGYFVVRTNRDLPSTREREQQRLRPLSFDPITIDSIEITDSDEASTVSLQLKDRVWRVTKPIEDLADPEHVLAILEAIPKAEWIEPLKPDEMKLSAWEATGLEKSPTHLVFRSINDLAGELWLGNASAIEGACYLSLPGDKGGERRHFVVRTPLPTLLQKPIEQWRDTQLLHVPAETISRVIISNGPGQIELFRDKPKAPWDMAKPLQTHGHNERIDELLAALLDLKTIALLPGNALLTDPAAPPLRFTITTAALPAPVELAIVPSAEAGATQTSATTSLRPTGFTVTSERLASLWVKVNEVRDPHLARIDTEAVDAISVTGSTASEVELRKDADHWMLKRHGQWEPASGERVEKVLKALNEAPVLEFVTDSAAELESYGLSAPLLTVTWHEVINDAPPQTPKPAPPQGTAFSVTPLVGTPTVLLFGTSTDGTLYAKYEAAPSIYRVGASILAALPRDSSRWKALNPLRFTQFALKRIAITRGTAPPVTLDYNPMTGTWTGSNAGRDLTALIDHVKADQLTNKLASLTVQDWLQDRTAAAAALATPFISVQLTLLDDPTNPNGPTHQQTINFAPTQPGQDTPFYYGRIDAQPDLFTYTRDDLRALMRSVLKQAAK